MKAVRFFSWVFSKGLFTYEHEVAASDFFYHGMQSAIAGGTKIGCFCSGCRFKLYSARLVKAVRPNE